MKGGRRMTLLTVLILVVVAAMAYVRLSPLDVNRWHRAPSAELPAGEHPGTGRFTGVYPQTSEAAAAFQRLHDVALATPRTEVLAGSPAEGMVTYVTRSRAIGFPDMTTAVLEPGETDGAGVIRIYARLRFGRSDMGVNKARVRDWVSRAGLAR